MSDLCEHVWQRLSTSPIRRAMLGRQRCDAIVGAAVAAIDHETLVAGDEFTSPWTLSRTVVRRVRATYRENCGFAFTTMILYWAISSIVQVLVIRWWNQHRRRDDPKNK